MTPRHVVRRLAAPSRVPARLLGGATALVLLAGCGSSTAPQGTDSVGDPGTVTATPDAATTAGTTAGTTGAATTAAPASPGTTSDGGTMTQTPAPDDALGPGAVLTAQDIGATVRLAPGEEVSMRLAPPMDAAEPSSDDPAVVEVVRVDHFADPGYAEFTLLAHGPGRATVRADGQGQDIVIHLHVTD